MTDIREKLTEALLAEREAAEVVAGLRKRQAALHDRIGKLKDQHADADEAVSEALRRAAREDTPEAEAALEAAEKAKQSLRDPRLLYEQADQLQAELNIAIKDLNLARERLEPLEKGYWQEVAETIRQDLRKHVVLVGAYVEAKLRAGARSNDFYQMAGRGLLEVGEWRTTDFASLEKGKALLDSRHGLARLLEDATQPETAA